MDDQTTAQRSRLVASLLRPEAYPWRPDRIELIETHISWVFLAGDRVVKIKRPVHFPFVDHRTMEQRRHSCEEEVRLNRRLTDGVYLGVVPIVQEGEEYVVEGAGEPVEWATLMRRLPADRMLDALLASEAVPDDAGERIANRLVPFHQRIAADCGAEPYGKAAALARVLTDNLTELEPFAGRYFGPEQLRLVATAMRSFLTVQTSLLEQRVRDGWVRDGHGDLRAEHICLEESGAVQVFDCVEFNPAIRCADVASDLAFLLMDLERLGAEWLAGEIEGAYRAAGVDLPPALLRLYRAHRALVRVKTQSITLSNAAMPHSEIPAEIERLFATAMRDALTVRPVLIAMSGLSGTGKSTVAIPLAASLGAPRFASDIVRKELAGVSGRVSAGWREGIYGQDWTRRTYDRLLDLATETLAAGKPVVLDATFLEGEYRERAAQVAAAAGVPFVLVETICDEDVVAERITRRAERGDAVSDATLAIYQAQRERLQSAPPPIPAGTLAFQIDTTRDDPTRLDPIFAGLERAGVLQPRLPA